MPRNANPNRPGIAPPSAPKPKPQPPSPFAPAAAAIFAQVTAYANALGVGLGDTTESIFGPFLAAGVAPADLLHWTKDFLDQIHSEGRTMYGEDTGAHMAGSTLIGFLNGSMRGKVYGDAVTTTADDVKRFIQALRANERGCWADIRAGTLTYETSKLPDIEAQIKAAGLQPTGGAA